MDRNIPPVQKLFFFIFDYGILILKEKLNNETMVSLFYQLMKYKNLISSTLFKT